MRQLHFNYPDPALIEAVAVVKDVTYERAEAALYSLERFQQEWLRDCHPQVKVMYPIMRERMGFPIPTLEDILSV